MLKKEESLLGIFSVILSFFSFMLWYYVIGFVFAFASMILSLISVNQKKKNKLCGIIGLVFSIIIIVCWYIRLTGELPI